MSARLDKMAGVADLSDDLPEDLTLPTKSAEDAIKLNEFLRSEDNRRKLVRIPICPFMNTQNCRKWKGSARVSLFVSVMFFKQTSW